MTSDGRHVRSLLGIERVWSQYENDLARLRPRPWPEPLAGWLGPSPSQRRAAALLEQAQTEVDVHADNYRREEFPTSVYFALLGIECSVLAPDGWGRYWLHPNLMARPDLVMEGLEGIDTIRKHHVIDVDDVVSEIRSRDQRLRAWVTRPPVIERAPDLALSPDTGGLESVGFISASRTNGQPYGDAHIRYTRKGTRGRIDKITVDHRLQGIGLAMHLLDALLQEHPEVPIWITSPQTNEGSALFAKARKRWPSYEWKNGYL
jgi:ribosomal protein S18 acetylase RimI-like enzyme